MKKSLFIKLCTKVIYRYSEAEKANNLIKLDVNIYMQGIVSDETDPPPDDQALEPLNCTEIPLSSSDYLFWDDFIDTKLSGEAQV